MPRAMRTPDRAWAFRKTTLEVSSERWSLTVLTATRALSLARAPASDSLTNSNILLRRCCGTHAPTLHNLQLFVLPHTETLSRSTASSVRLYFLSGPRLLAHLTSSHTLLTATAGIMSCGAPSVPERVQQVVDERKKATKRIEDLEAELAASVATELAATAPRESEGIVLHKHRTDDNTNALGFLSSITTAFSAKVKEGVPFLLVLSSSPSAQTGTSTTVVLIFGSDDNKVKAVGDEMKAKLNVKGGGKGSRWSGKFIGVWKEAKEGQVARILDSLQF